MNTDKSKATWDVGLTEIFLQQCIDQIYKRQRQGSSFTNDVVFSRAEQGNIMSDKDDNDPLDE